MTVIKPLRKPRKNKYTSHACTNCQKKKIRCKNHNNYDDACERCKKDGVPCVYLPKKKRRGRRKKNELALYEDDGDAIVNIPQTPPTTTSVSVFGGDGSARAHHQTSTIMQNPSYAGNAIVPASIRNATSAPIHTRRTGSALDRISIPAKSAQPLYNMELASPDFLNGSLELDGLDINAFTPLAITDSSTENVAPVVGAPIVDEDDVLHGVTSKLNTPLVTHELDGPDVPLGADDIVDLGHDGEALNGMDPITHPYEQPNALTDGFHGRNFHQLHRPGAKPSTIPLGHLLDDPVTVGDHNTGSSLFPPPRQHHSHFTNGMHHHSGDLSPSEFLSLPSDDDKKFADVTDPENIFNLQSPERVRFSPLYENERTGVPNAPNSVGKVSGNAGKVRKNLSRDVFASSTSTTGAPAPNGTHINNGANQVPDLFTNVSAHSPAAVDVRNAFATAARAPPKHTAHHAPSKPIHDIILRNSVPNGTLTASATSNIPTQLLHAARRGAIHELDSTIGTLPTEQQVQAIVLVQRLVDQLQQLGLTGETSQFHSTTTFEEEHDMNEE